MKLRPQQRPIEYIAEWLFFAIPHELCEEAKTRIASEIEAHYREAVEAHVEEGFFTKEAESLALEELGDPKKAARTFRKKHLTEREDARLRNMVGWVLKRPSNNRMMLEFTAFVALVAIALAFRRHQVWPWISLIAAAGFGMSWVCRLLARKLRPGSAVSWVIWIQIVFHFAAEMAIWGIALQSVEFPLYVGFMSFFTVKCLITSYRWYRIWTKVRSNPYFHIVPS